MKSNPKEIIKIAGGLEEHGVVTGNFYDKYGSRNPIVRRIMKGFHGALSELVDIANPNSIHEVGCGEGYWVIRWNKQGRLARGTDFSEQVIVIAKNNAIAAGVDPSFFDQRSIYEVSSLSDSAELVVCCEVLEHLEDPNAALEALTRIVSKHIILSVPREPLWCTLNMVRGRYLTNLGNTPGHIQHWGKKDFLGLVSNFFDIKAVRSPLPWTMVLASRRA